jgi:hypothetical protein
MRSTSRQGPAGRFECDVQEKSGGARAREWKPVEATKSVVIESGVTWRAKQTGRAGASGKGAPFPNCA